MGWNTSALFIKNRSVDEVVSLLPDIVADEPTGCSVFADQATSHHPGGRLYLAKTGTWCQMWDPNQHFALDPDMIVTKVGSEFLMNTTVLGVIFSSITDIFGFWLSVNGEVVRQAVFKLGDPVVEHGDPLLVEARLPVPSTGHVEYLWQIIESETDVTYDLDIPFEIYTVDA